MNADLAENMVSGLRLNEFDSSRTVPEEQTAHPPIFELSLAWAPSYNLCCSKHFDLLFAEESAAAKWARNSKTLGIDNLNKTHPFLAFKKDYSVHSVEWARSGRAS